jgi:zinc transport system substrate-binding protein
MTFRPALVEPGEPGGGLLLTTTFISISVRRIMSRVFLPTIAAIIAVLGLTGGCGPAGSQSAGAGGKPSIVAAFYPLEFAVREVGGDLVTVDGLTPSGVEPHDLELSVQQVRSLSDADLVVFLGAGFQPAIEDAVSALNEDRALDVLEGIDLLRGSGDHEHEDEEEQDPHVWLDPSNMTTIARAVAARLTEIDAAHAETYESNAEDLAARLDVLDAELAESLSECGSRDIVTSHAAFDYLAARYDLDQVSISGIDPEGEPSPGRLAEVARFVREHDVSTIFFEELVSPAVAETIANETGARTAMLSPLESQPRSGDYIDAMEANRDELTKALDCG